MEQLTPEKQNELISKLREDARKRREEQLEEIQKKLLSIVVSTDDFFSLVDRVNTTVLEGNRRFTDKQIENVVNYFFNKNKTAEQLRWADDLFKELHKANEMILEENDESIGVFYI